MTNLILTSEERDILTRILDEYFSELRMEITNTDNWKFKKGLKEEEVFLNHLLSDLRTDKAMEQEKLHTAKP